MMVMYARQRGLSLVEVMIGITIALVLTLGLMVLIMGTSRGFQSQDDSARLQESGMTALSYIGDSIRHAGFYGIGNAATTVDATNVATTVDCGSAGNPPAANWALNTIVPMGGFTGLTQANVNANGAILFLGSNYGTLRAGALHRTLFGGADAPIFEYQAHLYYVRPCSRTATPPGACLASIHRSKRGFT